MILGRFADSLCLLFIGDMPINMDTLLTVAGIEEVPDGAVLLLVDLVAAIGLRPTLTGEDGVRHTLTSRRVAAPALNSQRHMDQFAWVLPPQLVPYIDISVGIEPTLTFQLVSLH